MSDLTVSILSTVYSGKLDPNERGYTVKQEILNYLIKKGSSATTRDVADECELTIYSARRWLMLLEESGFLQKDLHGKNTIWSVRI